MRWQKILLIFPLMFLIAFHGHALRMNNGQSFLAQTEEMPDIKGIWDLSITFLDSPMARQSETSSLALENGGVLINLSPGLGIGSYEITGRQTFRYAFYEWDQQHIEYVQQKATLTSSTSYTAKGTGAIYDATGKLLGVAHTKTWAVRRARF